MAKNSSYTFSFLTASMNIHEMVKVAQSIVETREMDATNELGNGKKISGQKKMQEYTSRIRTLTTNQLQLLAHGNLNSQRQMAYLSICKSYGFIRDFVVEVLRDKILLFDYQIEDSDYLSFWRSKAELYPRMESFTESSQKKIRQKTFQLLAEADIIDSTSNKIIKIQIVDPAVERVILDDNPNWLKVFLKSDLDIQSYQE